MEEATSRSRRLLSMTDLRRAMRASLSAICAFCSATACRNSAESAWMPGERRERSCARQRGGRRREMGRREGCMRGEGRGRMSVRVDAGRGVLPILYVGLAADVLGCVPLMQDMAAGTTGDRSLCPLAGRRRERRRARAAPACPRRGTSGTRPAPRRRRRTVPPSAAAAPARRWPAPAPARSSVGRSRPTRGGRRRRSPRQRSRRPRCPRRQRFRLGRRRCYRQPQLRPRLSIVAKKAAC